MLNYFLNINNEFCFFFFWIFLHPRYREIYSRVYFYHRRSNYYSRGLINFIPLLFYLYFFFTSFLEGAKLMGRKVKKRDEILASWKNRVQGVVSRYWENGLFIKMEISYRKTHDPLDIFFLLLNFIQSPIWCCEKGKKKIRGGEKAQIWGLKMKKKRDG